MICEVKMYVDSETNAQVRVMVPVDKDENSTYVGVGSIGLPNGASLPIQFEIADVKNVEEAFGKFKECAEKHLEELEREMAEANRLVDSEGKPIGGNQVGNKAPLSFPSK